MEEQRPIDLDHILSSLKYPETPPLWQWQSDIDPWKYTDPSKWTWKNYSDQDSLIIEEAFSLNKETLDLQDYQLDFKKMLQVNKVSKDQIRRVRRQEKSRFMIEMPEPKILLREQKTMNEAFGTIQHFLNYIMKRTPEAYGLYERLQKLPLDCNQKDFGDVFQEVVTCIEKGAEAREKIIKSRVGHSTKNFLSEAKKLVDFIKNNSATLKDFLNALLKIYTMETFICYWLNELLRSEDWQEINVLTPYLVCLVYTFKLSDYTIPHKGGLIKTLSRLISRQKLSLYRGTTLTKDHLELYNLDKVKYFSWNGVTSTSRNKNIALNFISLSLSKTTEPKIGVLFFIKTSFASSKDREGMIDISQGSQYPDEQEVILAPGTVFKLLKTRLIENDIYEISLKVTKRFKKTKGKIPLLGILHETAIQNDTAILDGLPSQQSFRLLELFKGNKVIKKLEIKNSTLEEHIIEEIENLRRTTNLQKDDIKLVDNKIVVSNLSVIVDNFSFWHLNEIYRRNEILFNPLWT